MNKKMGSRPKGKNIWKYKLIAILLPFVLLFLIEAILRIAKYGDDLTLFVPMLPGNTSILIPKSANDIL